MLKHCVFCNFRSDVETSRRTEAIAAFAVLLDKIDGMEAFSAGPNLDFEAKSPAYSHGFVITFRDASALKTYSADLVHQKLGGELVALCQGGSDGIIVFDLAV
jgi:hypothetical protein